MVQYVCIRARCMVEAKWGAVGWLKDKASHHPVMQLDEISKTSYVKQQNDSWNLFKLMVSFYQVGIWVK